MNVSEIFYATDQALGSDVATLNHRNRIPVLSEYGGSKSLARRLNSIFNGCQLLLVEGDQHGYVAKAPQLSRVLPAYPVDKANPLDVSSFNNKFPQALEALLISGKSQTLKASYIEGVGGINIANIHRLACDLAQGAKPGMAICIVYGATDKMPLRALSYIIPGLVYAHHLKETLGIEPQLQIIFATNISSDLSHIDKDKALEQVSKLAGLARRFKAFF